MKVIKYLAACLLLFNACQNTDKQGIVKSPELKEIASPCKKGGEPNLFVSEGGQVYLSWVEYLNDTIDALLFSKLEGDTWSSPQLIAAASDWFVNWADFPSLVVYPGGEDFLAAHWLQMSAAGTYDYDVRIAQSKDAGKTWTESFKPHRDSISAEHGFVSLLPLSENRIFATWLDGRNTKGDGHHESGHVHHGAMSLRAATFDKEGKLYDEAELDTRVCDCCQTSAAVTDEGLIVAYRNRSEEEIRDIYVVRKVNGKWRAPKSVFNDDWKIAGCPVNGPVIKAKGKQVVVAWYTMSGGKPEVKVAFSNDRGSHFDVPIRIDEGNPLGRVDLLMLSEKEALVSWIEKNKTAAEIKAVKVTPGGIIGNGYVIAKCEASRQSGFPVMEKSGDQIVFAWTHSDSLTHVKTGILNL